MQGERRNSVIETLNKELLTSPASYNAKQTVENTSKQQQRSGCNPSVTDLIILIAWKQQTSLKFAYIGVCVAVKCAQQFNLTAFGCMHPRFVNGDVGWRWKWERKKFKCKIMGLRDEQKNYLNGL